MLALQSVNGAGATEDKSYALIKPGGTYAHVITGATSNDKIEAGKKWTDKKYSFQTSSTFMILQHSALIIPL